MSGTLDFVFFESEKYIRACKREWERRIGDGSDALDNHITFRYVAANLPLRRAKVSP